MNANPMQFQKQKKILSSQQSQKSTKAILERQKSKQIGLGKNDWTDVGVKKRSKEQKKQEEKNQINKNFKRAEAL